MLVLQVWKRTEFHLQLSTVACAYNSSTREAEMGGYLGSLRSIIDFLNEGEGCF